MDINIELRNMLEGLSASIRNAVGVSFSAASLLSDKLEEHAEQEVDHYLAVLQHSQHQMLRLAENIEDTLIANPSVLARETVDLGALCGHLADTVSVLLAKRNVHVRFSQQAHAVMELDYARIERMLLNILSNSIKYTPDGGEIQLTLSREGDVALLTVADNNGGLAQEDFDHLFTAFSRPLCYTDPARGAGFGMSAALGLARLHGGNILAENRPGEGLTVTVSLPDSGRADLLHVRYEPLKYGENPMRRVLVSLSDVLSSDEYTRRFTD